MINSNFNIDNSSINAVKAKVELYNGSTLVKTCTCSDVLQSFTVDRDEENNKFFGFGVCQSVKTELIYLNRELDITRGGIVTPALGNGTDFVYPYPTFYVEEVMRDEDTNSLTVTAYDAIYKASALTLADTGLTPPYSIRGLAESCAAALGLSGIVLVGIDSIEMSFDLNYPEGANFDGSETIRQVLDAIAEASQSVYYVSNQDKLIFKRLDVSGNPVITITKSDYFSLKTGANETIRAICHATELGDNILAGSEGETTQFVRDNPFWDLRDDAAELVESALAAVAGLSINQFICEDWIGNYLLEIGDKIALETEDGGFITSYLLNDVVTFDGTLSEATQWTYEPNDNETASSPSSLGEALNKTYARVDKAAKQVEIMASDVSNQGERLSSLELNTNSISATVSSVKTATEEAIVAINENFETISKQVSAKVSADDVTIAIRTEMSNGVDKVETSTGFTFNEEGLSVSKSGSEMTTQITEDGMTITRSGQETLVADNTGVRAENLHATTYLIIGNKSRFEDYGSDRTGCFWIGG